METDSYCRKRVTSYLDFCSIIVTNEITKKWYEIYRKSHLIEYSIFCPNIMTIVALDLSDLVEHLWLAGLIAHGRQKLRRL